MNIEIAVYLAFLAILYFYPNKLGSVGYFWICCYVLFQWLINEKLGVDSIIASSATGLSLLLTFEISRRLWEEPFSLPNVVQGLHWLLGKIGKLLSKLGFRPKTKFLDYNENDQVKVVKESLRRGDWDTLETLLADMLANDRYRVIKTVTDVTHRPTEYDRWLEARPNSAMAHIVSGHQLINWAWQARGGGDGSTVTNKGITLFYERLLQAREALETAITLENKYADPYVGLITISMGTGFDRDLLWEYFAKALVHTKDHYEAHISMINALAEKWGGEENEMFSVAVQAAFNADINSPLAGVIAVAHIEKWVYLGMNNLDAQGNRYFKQPKVRTELQQAYERIENCSLDTIEHIEALNAFAFCFHMAGLNALAKVVIDKLSGQFVDYPWSYSNKPFMVIIDSAYALDLVLNELAKDASNDDQIESDEELEANDSDSFEDAVGHLKNIPESGFAKVVLHNDDINGLGFVLNIVKDIFEYGTLKALWLLIQVSIKQEYPLWIGPTKEAKEMAMEIIARGPDPSMIQKGAEPLVVTIELVN